MNSADSSSLPVVNIASIARYPQTMSERDVIQVQKTAPESKLSFKITNICEQTMTPYVANTFFVVETPATILALGVGKDGNGTSLDGWYSCNHGGGGNLGGVTKVGVDVPDLCDAVGDKDEVWTVDIVMFREVDGEGFTPVVKVTGSLHPGMEWNTGIINIFMWPDPGFVNISGPSSAQINYYRLAGLTLTGMRGTKVVEAPVMTYLEPCEGANFLMALGLPKGWQTTMDARTFKVYVQNNIAEPYRLKCWCVTESPTPPVSDTGWQYNVLDSGPYNPWYSGGWRTYSEIEDLYDVEEGRGGEGGREQYVTVGGTGVRTLYLHYECHQGEQGVVSREITVIPRVATAPSGITPNHETRERSYYFNRKNPFVTNLEIADVNYGDRITVTLAAGEGDTDNGLMRVKAEVDPVRGEISDIYFFEPYYYPAARVYNYRLRATDSDGLYYEKAITFEVTA